MWNPILGEIKRTFFVQIYSFTINLFLFIIVVLVGFIFSSLIKRLLVNFLSVVGLDGLSSRFRVVQMLEREGVRYPISESIGMIFYWTGILISLIVALSVIGLTSAVESLGKIVFYLPNVIAAIFVLILGILISNAVKNIIKTLTLNAGIKQGHILEKVAEITIIIFTALIALKQLRIHTEIIEMAIAILLSSIGLAFAIAFGLGGSEIAGKSISDKIADIKRDKNHRERR